MRFSRRGGALEVKLDRHEAGVLTFLASELLELLGEGEAESTDPLAALVGLPEGDVRTPADPALARLLPDAYGDDPEAAREFRRFTEADLRAGKRAAATTVIASLVPALERGGRLRLDREQADAWLASLNDVRLMMATRLGVTADTELDPGPDHPDRQRLLAYGWLGWVQESLLARLDPGGA